MKFDALNFDCLESVLEYLELIDLLNVADSTRRLNKAAQLVYARKYGDKAVWLRNIGISPDRLFFIKDASTMIIEDLKTALQLLRCVGREISELGMIDILMPGVFSEVNIDKLSKRDQRLFTYINDYCAEYVKDIMMYPSVCYASTVMEHFDKPFPNVYRFQHTDYNFTGKVSLNRLFPKLNSLISCHTRNSSFFSINTNHFPYLEGFVFLESSSEAMLENEMLQAFIRLNPQLKELQLRSLDFFYSHLNTDLLRNAVECLQNIEFLMLDIKPIAFLKDSDNIIHMKSVKNFAIYFHQIYELPECFLPFSFEQLKQFQITFPEQQFLNSFIEEFYNFIDENSNISNVRISNIRPSNVDWSRLARSLPLLDRIKLYARLSTDEAIELMAKFRMLKKFEFFLKDEYGHFRERLGYEWESKYDTAQKFVELKRKT